MSDEKNKVTKEEMLNEFTFTDIENAQNQLAEICKDPSKFTMCIPPQRYDTDILFTRVFDMAKKVSKSVIHLDEFGGHLITIKAPGHVLDKFREMRKTIGF